MSMSRQLSALCPTVMTFACHADAGSLFAKFYKKTKQPVMTLTTIAYYSVQRSLVPRDDKARNKIIADTLKV
jgi:hypothetical protein